MTETQSLLAGPACAVLALLLFLIPHARPRVFVRGIGWLAVCMVVPMVAGFAVHSYDLLTVAFLLKPISALVSLAFFLGYVMMWRSRRLPPVTLLPSLVLLCGAVADMYAICRLGNGWGGASC